MNNVVVLFFIALCGTCTSSSLNRIAGGSPAAQNQFQYMISLQQKSQVNTPTRGHRCGGALVSLRHAVTAASCINDRQNGDLNPNDYRVFAGAVDLTNDASADNYRDIERFTLHPEYSPGADSVTVNDIAVITLLSAFSSNNVHIAPLATNNDQLSLAHCTSSGWGAQNDTSVASTQLMHVEKFAIADNTQCQPFYMPPYVQQQLTLQNTMICAMALEPYSSCQGDTGNPLVCSENLQGILISPVYSCSVLNQTARPEIYTRISSFESWIRTTAGASSFQPAIGVFAVITIVQIVMTNI